MKMKRILTTVIGTVLVFGIYTLLDFLYSTFISHSAFTFDTGSNLITPVVVGVLIFGVLIPMNDKDMDKSKIKYEGINEKRHHKAPAEEEEKENR